MIQKIDHIGIAVRSLAEAMPFYERALDLTCERIETVDSQQVRTAFYACGEVHLELLEATGPESPVAKFIAKNGEGVHHIAFRTDGIEAQLRAAESAGTKLINAEPVAGAGGKRVAFLHPKSTHGVLMELCAPAGDA